MTAYAIRGAVISLLAFLLTFTALWVASVVCFIFVRRFANRFSSSMLAGMLYGLQVAPFIVAAITVAALALPSFLLFEPRAAEEPIRAAHVLFSLVAVAVIGTGLYRGFRAYAGTRRLTKAWERSATAESVPSRLPVFQTSCASPPLVVAGIFNSKIFISAPAWRLLTPNELRSAIAHESVHANRHDNLKKLLLRLCCPWRVPHFEQEWLQALELSADECAVGSHEQAVELASALVKLSRLSAPGADLAAGLTAESAVSVETRVQRLLAWRPPQKADRRGVPGTKVAPGASFTISIIAGTILAAVFAYEPLLRHLHSFTETLMR